MGSTLIESVLFGGAFGDDQMRQIFSDESLVARLLMVEVALARAEGRIGLIPEDAAEEITKKARPGSFPLTLLRKGNDATGHSLVPLVRALGEACEGTAGGYVHWGATTQDIYDTANVLRYREAIEVVLSQLRKLRDELARMAEREADTLIAGRTHGQHALPTTFGYKVAVWCWEVHRHIERWEQAKPRILVGNIAGGVGSFASFEGKGLEVQRLALEDLGLGVPEICWHTSRDRSAELGSLLALTAATLEKIAGELYRLQTTEYGETEEPFHMGKVGSSTMPHKRNAVMCEAVISAGRAVRAEASMAVEAVVQEHERHSAIWKTEWIALPNSFIYLGGGLAKLNKTVAGLKVNRKRMEQNLELSHGAMLSEAVMLQLGRFVGRDRAHQIVYEASMKAFEENRPVRDCIGEVEEITRHLSDADLDALFDYRAYVGDAPALARMPAEQLLRQSELSIAGLTQSS